MQENYMHDSDKVFEMVMAFNGETRYERLLDIILEKMMELTYSDAGTLYILEDNALHFRIIKNKTLNTFLSDPKEINLPPVVLDKDNIKFVSAYTAIKNEIVVVDDVYDENSKFNFSGPKNYDKMTGYRSRSMLVFPLSTMRNERPKVLGVIQLMNATDPATGEATIYRDLYNPPVLPALANIAANTLGNLIHINEIRMLFHSFAAAMARTIDERSSYNSNHTLNVADLCRDFADFLSSRFPVNHPYYFDEKRLEDLTMSAILHDIGKIVTPTAVMDKTDKLGHKLAGVRYRFQIKKLQLDNDMHLGVITKEENTSQNKALSEALALVEASVVPKYISDEQIEEIKKLAALTYKDAEGKTAPILDKDDIGALTVRKGTLTEEERLIMQEHVAVTGRILENAAFARYYKNVLEWARSHHEFLDGTGYPRGLTALPVETCILTIIDIYEALTATDRPYKKAMPQEKAINILTEMANEGKLHGELVQLFKEHLASKGAIK